MTTPVQFLGGSTDIASGTAAAVLSANPQIGNTVLLAIASVGAVGNDVTNVTTTFGTATKVGSQDRNFLLDLEWWIVPVTAVGNQITVTLGSGSTWFCLASEWPGKASSTYGVASSNADATSLSQACTPAAANDILLVFVTSYFPFTADPGSNTPPWTMLNSGNWADANGISLAYMQAPSTAAETATWTIGSSSATALIGIGMTLPPSADLLIFC